MGKITVVKSINMFENSKEVNGIAYESLKESKILNHIKNNTVQYAKNILFC